MPVEKDTQDPTSADPSVEESEYSVFAKAEKWCIVVMVSYAACFSTLSSFIYFPALQPLADSFSVSVAKINLAITCYMAVATVAPILVGDTADTQGRRPVYILALTLYVGSNVGMALARSYAAHLGLRVAQAMAISGTFSIAYGVVTDVTSPGERGAYINSVSFASTVAPSIGPILGGGLSYTAGWPWIFWFLSIASGACLIMMVFLLPETSRNIVGNGSVRPPGHLRLPVPRLFRHWTENTVADDRKRKIPNPLRSLKILTRVDNLGLALSCGFLYTVYTCINATLSVLLIDMYSLEQWQVGLIYLPFGLGGVISTFFCGQLLDKAYLAARTERGLSTDLKRGDNLDTFPIEKARLRVIWIPMAITCATVAGLGWVLHYKQHLAAPIVLLFVAGLVMQMDFSIYNTLLVDKNHRTPAAAQASSNVVRCTMAAVAMAFLQDLIDAVGVGWIFTLLAGLCAISLSLFVLDYHRGTAWRQRSLTRL
ncbi:multidrug resistance protein [Dactylonectria macrodidyma]|uniref:Multidrug resistance protein n=1 Tax=Dactylonectria macrodidyma TaxID=307937 RepID=A0A9P9JGS1_9HYPO|nr:multidrug resistance protein [Dactylonectria macrodidyma]